MKKILSLLCLLGFTQWEMAKAAPLKRVSTKAPSKKASKQAAKKSKTGIKTVVAQNTVKAEDRSPALASGSVEVVVNPENSDFESMVKKKEELSRRPAGFSATARVISLRRELGLTRAEADSAPQDIILNAGFKAGVSEGMVLKAARKIPILDPYHDNQQSELTVQFATLKVVHVEEEIAVARVEKIDPIRGSVGVGLRGILVGDYVGN